MCDKLHDLLISKEVYLDLRMILALQTKYIYYEIYIQTQKLVF